MPKNLHRYLDQLVFLQIKHKAGCGKPFDGFRHILLHLLLSVPIDGYVIQVDDYGQGMVAQHAKKDTLNHKPEISGHLCKPHWYPEPPTLAPVGKIGQVIRRSAFK